MRKSRIPALEGLEGRALPAPLATPGLVVRLATDHKVYHRGQPVTMTLTETNASGHALDVTLGPSIDGFSVTQAGRTVWASNAGPQPLFVRLQTLAPGASTTLTATWDGRSNLGPASTPTGPLVVHSQVAGARPVAIRVLPS